MLNQLFTTTLLKCTFRVVILILVGFSALCLQSCERQKMRLNQRAVRQHYYDSVRRTGWIYRDSVFRAQQNQQQNSVDTSTHK